VPLPPERYRLLVDRSPDAIVVVRSGRIEFTNAAGLQWIGLSPDEVAGQPFEASFHFHHRDAVGHWLARLGAGDPGGAATCVTTSMRGAEGLERHVELRGALLDPDGPVIEVVARDVTARTRAEAALRENEERLRLAFAGSQEGVWDWDLETNAVVYSARWKQMLGYSDEEIEPHLGAWQRLLHPDDRSRAQEVYDSVNRGDQMYEGEFRLRHKDGHYVHVLSRGFPVRRTPGGPPVRIVGTHFDLTERKRAEAALRESEERLTLAFAGAQEGVWDWNLETGSVVYSARWKEMLGYGDDEVEPHVSAWERLLHPDDKPRAQQLNDSIAGGARTYEGEFRLRHKDGHYVHVLSRGFPVRRTPDGAAVRIVGTHFDLTERKRADAERARTELLARLIFAQEDERRRIAREMHDQFGEQLTALEHGIAALKAACADRADLHARVDLLQRIARQLDRDVDQLVWELRPTALDDLGLRAALANYVQDWSKRVGIAAELHTSGLLDDRLPADVETALYRIAQEALTNVAKHSKATTVEVILERRPDHVLLVVEDDGVGFEQAARADGAPHGFGLHGMQERAALVGATLHIESSLGEGTTILVRMSAATPLGHQIERA
jgi:PAS domain S-box-containing protein